MIAERDLKKVTESTLFRTPEPDKLLQILENGGCHAESYTDGELIRSPESTERAAGMLLSGKAAVTTPDPARNTLLRFLETDAIFGIANLFSEEPYISRIHADGACRVFWITEAAMRALLESDQAFLYRYLAFLSGRIRFLNQKIGYLTAGGAERRLALYLLSRGNEAVVLNDSISALSDLLDIGRASLYRAFDKLTEDGFILKDGRRITLLDPDGMLRAYH